MVYGNDYQMTRCNFIATIQIGSTRGPHMLDNHFIKEQCCHEMDHTGDHMVILKEEEGQRNE